MTEDKTMDRAVGRLEKMWVTGRYLQVWWEYMGEEEKKLHLSRITEELANARQIANYWRQFAEKNGVLLKEEG